MGIEYGDEAAYRRAMRVWVLEGIQLLIAFLAVIAGGLMMGFLFWAQGGHWLWGAAGTVPGLFLFHEVVCVLMPIGKTPENSG